MSAEHDACRRARYDARTDTWRCARCGTAIGHASVAWIPARGLVPLGRIHGGVRTFGLPNAARERGERPEEVVVSPLRFRGREFYVYCPARECRAGQHVSLTRPR